MYKYIFGPVPSRRLGMSLGVDLVPRKVCSLDCVYCEVGKTTRLTTERKEYVPYKKIIDELSAYFGSQPDPDYITFSGSGEPTLNLRIGDVLQFIKQNKPGIPIAVLTNGTLLHDAGLRSELQGADLVLPSLDAATEAAFNRINRPHASIDVDRYIQGLVDFRQSFAGRIWLEVLILPAYNDSEEDLEALRNAIVRIQPDAVQLNTLDRPGTVKDLRAATTAELQRIRDLWQLDYVEIIAAPATRKRMASYRPDTEEAILETIARRPCTTEDLAAILGLHVNEVNKYLDILEAEKKIVSSRQDRGIFYKVSGA